MNKTRFLFVLLVLVFSLILVGCGGQGGSTEGNTQEPVTESTEPVVVPTVEVGDVVDQTIRLDPATVEDTDSLALSTYVYDGLTVLDENGNAQPALATSWTVSDDELDYIVELRQGVTFHSGATFNADAVLANFNRWFDPEDPLHGTGTYMGWLTSFVGFKGDIDENSLPVSPYDGIEKSGEYTVIIHLNRPVLDLLQTLAKPYFLILDPALLASAGADYGTSAETVSGTGAYSVSSWTAEGLVLSPNASYWGEVPAGDLQFGWR